MWVCNVDLSHHFCTNAVGKGKNVSFLSSYGLKIFSWIFHSVLCFRLQFLFVKYKIDLLLSFIDIPVCTEKFSAQPRSLSKKKKSDVQILKSGSGHC